MNALQAFILGLIQGLTEFLPVSSSGHIELGKALLGVEVKEDLTFSVVVHGATVLSTIVVFRNDIWLIIKDVLKFQWNESTQYAAKIILSMIPVVVIGVLYKDIIEQQFGNIVLVGFMLIITGMLLLFTYYAKEREDGITFGKAFIIGMAQAIAVLPGISRSGSTIATGLLLGVKKEHIAKFSFLMVLVPIIGANMKDILDGGLASSSTGTWPLLVGFISAFISGLLACSLMLRIVKQGKLIYFAIYCFIIGAIAIATYFF